jgi:hypothetical protein
MAWRIPRESVRMVDDPAITVSILIVTRSLIFFFLVLSDEKVAEIRKISEQIGEKWSK